MTLTNKNFDKYFWTILSLEDFIRLKFLTVACPQMKLINNYNKIDNEVE